MKLLRRVPLLALGVLAALIGATRAGAQANLPVYTDSLVNSFEDWSWATHNLGNTAPVRSATKSISVTAAAWQALSSTNLSAWSPFGTNVLTGSMLNFTNPIPAGVGRRFWRAVWQP